MDPLTSLLELIELLTSGIAKAQETPCLSTGTHYYRWYANDTSGNWNSTELLSFTLLEEDPLIIHILSPENKTYETNSIDLTYSVESDGELSWIGYSLDGKPNVTLTGNTSITVSEGVHHIVFYANNTFGTENSTEIIFTVSLPKPDLIIEDIWVSGNKIYYKIKNAGNADSKYSYSKLYIDNYYKAYDYVPSLGAGSSSNEYFSYSWSCSGSYDSIRVCADGWNYVKESDETNNCRTENFKCSTR